MLYGPDKSQKLNESFLKRKDPKTMSLDELEEYIHQNKSKLKTEESQLCSDQMYSMTSNDKPFNSSPKAKDKVNNNINIKDNELYIKELEIKVEELFKQNEELKTNFIQLSELLQKERNEHSSRLQSTISINQQKYIEEHEGLMKEIDDLKLQNTIQNTNISILTSEKERHLEQNAIDKEYFESKISKLIEENKTIKREIKDHVVDFSNVIEEQKDLIEADYKEQIKSLKDIISKNEREKKDIIKKYDNKIREMTVKINRLERNNDPLAKSKSRSKGKLSELISSYRSTKSKSKSKGKIKPSKNNMNSNNVSLRFNSHNENMDSNSVSIDYALNNMTPIYLGQSLPSINDNIFSLERSIADLNRNYSELKDKLKHSTNQEDIALLKRNSSILNNDIEEQKKQLQLYKSKQQEFLKNGYVIDTL